MKYANPQKTAVTTQHPTNGQTWTVPRGHRFWTEWGIDKAEQENRINDPDPIIEPGSDSGSN